MEKRFAMPGATFCQPGFVRGFPGSFVGIGAF